MRCVAVVPAIHESGDAGDVGFVGQHLQVKLQFNVFVIRLRHANRRLREIRRDLADQLDAALNLANFIEIVIEPGAIARTDDLPKAGYIMGDRIEDAAVLLLPGDPLRSIAAITKKTLEDYLRIDFHGKRFPRSLP